MPRANLILDRYEPIGTAGTGGFATVQIAWDPRIQRKVAIKTIRLTEQDAYRAGLPGAQAIDNPSPTYDRWHGVTPWNEFLENEGNPIGSPYAFENAYEVVPVPDEVHALAHLPGLDEARTAAMLADPRIVTVFDFEVRGRTAYLIMEYVEGLTLTRLLADYEDLLSLDVIAAVFHSVAGALSVAHEAGVLHLDIKPDNILVNAKGEVKVTDFGLATLADASGKGTTGGGTIGYMPLEQMRREHLDARTDEWSLAAVTYEMLTGENPFFAPNLEEAELAIEEAELVVPSLCWDDLDEQIDDVVFYALDPDRDERYDTVADFAEEAEKFLGDVGAGVDQMSYIVSDALGLIEADDVAGEDEPASLPRGSGVLDRALARLGLARIGGGLLAGARAPRDADDVPFDGGRVVKRDAASLDEWDEPEEWDDWEEEAAPLRPKREKRDHVALRDRVPERMRRAFAHALAGVSSAAVAFLGAANTPLLALFGAGSVCVMAALAVAIGALGALRPHVGALASFGLLGIALVATGSPIPGILLLASTAAWWYFVARSGVAACNVALASPLFGAFGGFSATPLFAGATLRPISALATAAYAGVCAIVFASFGSLSLVGWDVFANWRFANADVTGNLLWLAQRLSTWLTLAGWLAAAFVQALFCTRGSRRLEVFGLACAVAIVAGTTLFHGVPSVGLAVSLVAAALAVLAVVL